jgi:hypothetical protein
LHLDDGRGGYKVSWKPMGTLWSRNITSDPEAGLGKWSDSEITRAIRSGVSRNGYQLHWQGMTWDHASNWDEEDIRALIAYLRAMPPVSIRYLPTVFPLRMIARCTRSGPQKVMWPDVVEIGSQEISVANRGRAVAATAAH